MADKKIIAVTGATGAQAGGQPRQAVAIGFKKVGKSKKSKRSK